MLGRATKVRLAAFLIIAVVGIGYTGGKYAGLDRLFGSGGYTVTTRLAASGGLFVNAEVTYRGKPVGRVRSMRLTDEGIAVKLHINDEAPKIPADTRAVVANRSAIGEQYIDLRPPDNQGPYLRQGSVIPERRTTLPPSPESLLLNLDKFVSSIPADSLRTVVNEAGKAFRGTADSLQKLLDSASSLTNAALEHLPATTELLDNGKLVLQTQKQQAAKIKQFSSGFRKIAAQLKKSDPDLEKLIKAAPGVGRQINQFLYDSGDDVGVLLANMLTVSKIFNKRQPAIEQSLVALPILSAFTHSVNFTGDRGRLAIVLNFFNPLACTDGYEGTPRRPGSVTTPAPPNYDVHCDEPPDSPINVRGARNAPSPGVPGEPVPHPPLLPLVGAGKDN